MLLIWRAATRFWGTEERMDKFRRGYQTHPIQAVLGIVWILGQCEGKSKEIHSYCPNSFLLTAHYYKYYGWVSHSEEIGNLTLLTHFRFTNHFHHHILIYFFFYSYISATVFLNFCQGADCSCIIYCSVNRVYWFVTKSWRCCGGSWVSFKMKSK